MRVHLVPFLLCFSVFTLITFFIIIITNRRTTFDMDTYNQFFGIKTHWFKKFAREEK